MDENAKEYLYEQLEQIAQYSVREDKEELISKEEFMGMTGADCLKYVFQYRDSNEPYEFNGEKGETYIQIPNMDLSNEDLNDVILRVFILSHPENDDEVISSINFANTGITLDLNSILENKTEQTGAITKRIIDFSQCNFEGCTIYGILPDEYQSETAKITDGYEVRGREKLGEEYTKRREKLHDVQAPKTLSRRAYERLIDGRDFSRLNGITDATEIHLEDFDFEANDEQELGEMYQILYEELEDRRNLDGIYTNMNLSSEFIKSTFQKLNGRYAKEKFLQELVREGKELDFVKEKFKGLYSEEILQELIRQGKELDFVKEEFERLVFEDKSQVLQELIRQGKELNFVKEKYEDLSYISRIQVLQELIRQGKELDFVKEEFERLGFEDKSPVLQELVRQGKELDFVKEKYESLYYGEDKSPVLQELVRQGKELDFVKEKFEGLYSADKSPVLQELVRQGKESEFVYKNARYIQDEETKKKIKEQALRKGISEKKIEWQLNPNGDNLLEFIDEDIDFVKENFEVLVDKKYKSQVLQELIRQGKELDFVKRKFDELYGYDKSQVLQELVSQGQEFEFVYKNARYIQDEETKKKIKEQALRKGISEKKIEWQLNPNGDNLLKFIDEDIDFVKENFEVLVDKDKSQVLQELIRQGKELNFIKENFKRLTHNGRIAFLHELIEKNIELAFVYENWRYVGENETIAINSSQFRDIIGCGEKESKELIKLMESTQINLANLIRKKVILASCGIDIKDALKNRTLMQTSPVVLYAKKRYYESVGQPTNISNLGMSRAKFENMSGKTLTGICNEYVFSDRYDNLKDTVVEEINKEIQEQKEKKAKQAEKMPNQQQSRTDAESNYKTHKANPVVSTFLQTQVGITEKQEQKLREWLQRFNYDIYSKNVEEDLTLKKQIFDQFEVTSQAFGMSCKILTIPLKTLYARAQFLKDIEEKITPANLMATLGANGDIFAQKYGSYFMEEKSEQDAQYIMKVENATNETYPMPKTKEEIMRKIKEMEEEQK